MLQMFLHYVATNVARCCSYQLAYDASRTLVCINNSPSKSKAKQESVTTDETSFTRLRLQLLSAGGTLKMPISVSTIRLRQLGVRIQLSITNFLVRVPTWLTNEADHLFCLAFGLADLSTSARRGAGRGGRLALALACSLQNLRARRRESSPISTRFARIHPPRHSRL